MLFHQRMKEMVFLPIPGFERYLISPNGTVLDTIAEAIIQDNVSLKLNTKVRLLYPNRTDRFRSVSVARLILITHCPLKDVDLDVVWGPKLKLGPNSQITTSNLDYDFGDYIPPIPRDLHEFHPVPGYIETEINLAGVVRMSGVEGKIGDQRGYAVASARLPNGVSVTVGRHRLMALTFLRHPVHCEDLIVNHKNGTPKDDCVKNLEWVTHLGNMLHAHETKLVSTHIPVEVLNNSTGEVKEFFSIGAFSRFYELNQRESKRLEFRMRNFGIIHNYRGFTIRRKDRQVPWENIPALDGYKGNAKEVVVRSNSTDEVREFVWFQEACEFLNISQYRLRNGLQKFGKVCVGDYTVSYATPSLLAGNLERC